MSVHKQPPASVAPSADVESRNAVDCMSTFPISFEKYGSSVVVPAKALSKTASVLLLSFDPFVLVGLALSSPSTASSKLTVPLRGSKVDPKDEILGVLFLR